MIRYVQVELINHNNTMNKQLLVRLSSRIRPDQDVLIKKKAKKSGESEGSIIREALDLYLKTKPGKN